MKCPIESEPKLNTERSMTNKISEENAIPPLSSSVGKS